jgi:hypothetical protein
MAVQLSRVVKREEISTLIDGLGVFEIRWIEK